MRFFISFNRIERDQRGNITLLLLTAMLGMIPLMSSAFNSLFQQRLNLGLKDWNALAASEAASAGITLMESALSRRLWEMPPDANCLRSTLFDLGTPSSPVSLPNGGSVYVHGTFDPANNLVTLESTGKFKNTLITLSRQINIWDASDFLVFSKNPNPTRISRPYNQTGATALVGGLRQIYFEGPVQFQSGTWNPFNGDNNLHHFTSVPQPYTLPNGFGIILQGSRMSFLGGLSYGEGLLPLPNSSRPNARAALLPYGYDVQDPVNFPPKRMGIASNWGAFFTSDHRLASELQKHVNQDPGHLDTDSTASLLFGHLSSIDSSFSEDNLMKGFYPQALFGRTEALPLDPQTATDDGNYRGDPRTWLHWSFSIGQPLIGGTDMGVTCLARCSLGGSCTAANGGISAATRKQCSSNLHFPQGYQNWISDNAFKGVVVGQEGEKLNFPTLTWDQMDALKEDAAACGVIIGASATDSYEDCDLSNSDVINRYLTDPTTNPCMNVRKYSMESLESNLNNFNPSSYETLLSSDPNNKNLFLRRVIYTDRPVEITQSHPGGLASTLTDSTARRHLSLWLVNEDQWIFKPYQNLSDPGPLFSEPERRRKVYFNEKDVPTATTLGAPLFDPLRMVVLSPELPTIISAAHVPYSYADMQSALPVTAGKINPRNHILTDYAHQENDAFKYGVRDIMISNISLMTNALSPYSSSIPTGFHLRGLWSGRDAGATQWIRNSCMLAQQGQPNGLNVYGGPITLPYAPSLPLMVPATSIEVPPVGSNFYMNGATAQISPTGTPFVFHLQATPTQKNRNNESVFDRVGANGPTPGTGSRIHFNGLRYGILFGSQTPTGRRNLAAPKLVPKDSVAYSQVDMSDRRIFWKGNAYFRQTPTVFNLPEPSMPGITTDPSNSITCQNPNLINNSNQAVTAGFDILLNWNGQSLVHTAPDPSFSQMGSIFSVGFPTIIKSQP